MAIKIGINGCSRIGKLLVRLLYKSEQFEIAVINDPMPSHILTNLLKFDSQHGKFNLAQASSNDHLEIGGHSIALFYETEPKSIPWGDFGISCVLEASRMFKTRKNWKNI